MNSHAKCIDYVSGKVQIVHAQGLHARPSVMFTRLAKQFNAIVEVSDSTEGPWIDAKSIVKVMGLKAPCDTVLFIRAQGPDAQSAVGQLIKIVAEDFRENTNSVGGIYDDPARV